MKGNVIIPRAERDFEVAHRIEAGVHWLEVSVGSSFNEIYWDAPAQRIVSEPDTYDGLVEVLRRHEAAACRPPTGDGARRHGGHFGSVEGASAGNALRSAMGRLKMVARAAPESEPVEKR